MGFDVVNADVLESGRPKEEEEQQGFVHFSTVDISLIYISFIKLFIMTQDNQGDNVFSRLPLGIKEERHPVQRANEAAHLHMPYFSNTNRPRADSQPNNVNSCDPLISQDADEAETLEHTAKFRDYLKLLFSDLISKDSSNRRSSISRNGFMKFLMSTSLTSITFSQRIFLATVSQQLMEKVRLENFHHQISEIRIPIDDVEVRCSEDTFVKTMTDLYFGQPIVLQELIFDIFGVFKNNQKVLIKSEVQILLQHLFKNLSHQGEENWQQELFVDWIGIYQGQFPQNGQANQQRQYKNIHQLGVPVIKEEEKEESGQAINLSNAAQSQMIQCQSQGRHGKLKSELISIILDSVFGKDSTSASQVNMNSFIKRVELQHPVHNFAYAGVATVTQGVHKMVMHSSKSFVLTRIVIDYLRLTLPLSHFYEAMIAATELSKSKKITHKSKDAVLSKSNERGRLAFSKNLDVKSEPGQNLNITPRDVRQTINQIKRQSLNIEQASNVMNEKFQRLFSGGVNRKSPLRKYAMSKFGKEPQSNNRRQTKNAEISKDRGLSITPQEGIKEGFMCQPPMVIKERKGEGDKEQLNIQQDKKEKLERIERQAPQDVENIAFKVPNQPDNDSFEESDKDQFENQGDQNYNKQFSSSNDVEEVYDEQDFEEQCPLPRRDLEESKRDLTKQVPGNNPHSLVAPRSQSAQGGQRIKRAPSKPRQKVLVSQELDRSESIKIPIVAAIKSNFDRLKEENKKEIKQAYLSKAKKDQDHSSEHSYKDMTIKSQMRERLRENVPRQRRRQDCGSNNERDLSNTSKVLSNHYMSPDCQNEKSRVPSNSPSPFQIQVPFGFQNQLLLKKPALTGKAALQAQQNYYVDNKGKVRRRKTKTPSKSPNNDIKDSQMQHNPNGPLDISEVIEGKNRNDQSSNSQGYNNNIGYEESKQAPNSSSNHFKSNKHQIAVASNSQQFYFNKRFQGLKTPCQSNHLQNDLAVQNHVRIVASRFAQALRQAIANRDKGTFDRQIMKWPFEQSWEASIFSSTESNKFAQLSIVLKVRGPDLYAFKNLDLTPLFIVILSDCEITLIEEGGASCQMPDQMMNAPRQQPNVIPGDVIPGTPKFKNLTQQRDPVVNAVLRPYFQVPLKFEIKIKINDKHYRLFQLPNATPEKAQALYQELMKGSRFWKRKQSLALQRYQLDGTEKEAFLGKGSFGKVYRARDSVTGMLVALKQISKEKMDRDDFLTVAEEIEILQVMTETLGGRASNKSDPGIVQLYDVIEDIQNITLVLEFFEGKDLFEWVVWGQMNLRLPHLVKECKSVFRQISESLKKVHDLDIVHRDLKLANILIRYKRNQDGTSTFQTKLIDFGLGTVLQTGQESRSYQGTIAFLSAEVVSGKSHDRKNDIWSMGIIFYTMISGHIPFIGYNMDQTTQNIMTKEIIFEQSFWQGIPIEVKDLIFMVLKKNPLHRFSIDQILEDKCFSEQQEDLQVQHGALSRQQVIDIVMGIS